MKRILFILTSLLALASCREVLPKHFDDITGVYFSNYASAGMLSDRKEFTFAYVDGDSAEVPVSIQLLGRTSENDRTIALEAVSSDAVQGTDYEIPSAAILPAGSSTLSYNVILHRTPGLKTDTRTLVLRLKENADFIVPFTFQTTTGGTTVSADTYTIVFNDQFTVAPEGWSTLFVGAFSQQKFELICDVCGLSRAEFTVKGGISSARWMYIQTVMLRYVLDQETLRNAGESYDERAFDDEGNPLRFI